MQQAYENALNSWSSSIVMSVDVSDSSIWIIEENNDGLTKEYKKRRETRIRTKIRIYGINRNLIEHEDGVICVVYVNREFMCNRLEGDIDLLTDSLDVVVAEFERSYLDKQLDRMISSYLTAKWLFVRISDAGIVQEALETTAQGTCYTSEMIDSLNDVSRRLQAIVSGLVIKVNDPNNTHFQDNQYGIGITGKVLSEGNLGIKGVPLELTIISGLDFHFGHGENGRTATESGGFFRLPLDGYVLTREIGRMSIRVDMDELKHQNRNIQNDFEMLLYDDLVRVEASCSIKQKNTELQEIQAERKYVPGGSATFNGDIRDIADFEISSTLFTYGELHWLLQTNQIDRSVLPPNYDMGDPSIPATGLPLRTMSIIASALGGRLPSGHEWILASQLWDHAFQVPYWEAVTCDGLSETKYYIIRLITDDYSHDVQFYRKSPTYKSLQVTFRILW